MTAAILNLVGSAALEPAGRDAQTSTVQVVEGDFQAALSARLRAKPPAHVAAPAEAHADDAALRTLEAKLTKLLKAGASPAEVCNTLAAQLAASVAQALGTTTATARAHLQAVLHSALAPPGKTPGLGPPGASVRRLAQRYLEVEALAARVAEQTAGQPNRIAGHLLDATAKELPAPPQTAAPTTATTGSGAWDGVPSAAASTSNVDPAAATQREALGQGPVLGVSGVLPDADLAAADGRRVRFASPAASAGGDTLLGRTLARAAVAAEARAANVAPKLDDGTTAFVQAFASALDHGGADPKADVDPDANPVASALLAGALPAHDGAGASAAIPSVAPFRIETATVAAAPREAASAPPADQPSIVDQVLRGAFMRTSGESSEMRLSLVPQTLGDVTVKLVVTAGNVTAHVVAQTPDVRDALIAAQPQLTKSLADAGLKLQSFSVDLSGGGFAGFAQSEQRQAAEQRASAATRAGGNDGDDSALEAVPSFAPPRSLGRGPGDYNYLA